MRKSLTALVFASSLAAVAENSVVDLYSTYKDYSGSDPFSTASATTYTLSNDLDLKLGDKQVDFRFRYYDGTVMDFTAGSFFCLSFG